MSVRRAVVIMSLAVYAVGACARAVEGPRIAFSSWRAGGWDIYVANLENDDLQRITRHPAVDRHASWSPDGTELAFASRRDGDSAVYIMAADGRNVRRVEGIEGWAAHPAWAPDGKRLAYANGGSDLYTVSLATGQSRFLADHVVGSKPAWSPDGRVVAYGGSDVEQNHRDVFTVEVDGGERRNLTNAMWADQDPTWSPGGQIAFSSWREPGRAIHVMDADGANVHAVTDDTLATNRHVHPNWSAGGRWITYDSWSEVHVLDMTSGQSRVVVTGAVRNEGASIWVESARAVSPVGRRSDAWGWLKTVGSRISR